MGLVTCRDSSTTAAVTTRKHNAGGSIAILSRRHPTECCNSLTRWIQAGLYIDHSDWAEERRALCDQPCDKYRPPLLGSTIHQTAWVFYYNILIMEGVPAGTFNLHPIFCKPLFTEGLDCFSNLRAVHNIISRRHQLVLGSHVVITQLLSMTISICGIILERRIRKPISQLTNN